MTNNSAKLKLKGKMPYRKNMTITKPCKSLEAQFNILNQSPYWAALLYKLDTNIMWLKFSDRQHLCSLVLIENCSCELYNEMRWTNWNTNVFVSVVVFTNSQNFKSNVLQCMNFNCVHFDLPNGFCRCIFVSLITILTERP